MSKGEPLGHIIDALGVTHHPKPGEIVASAVVVIRVINEDGAESIRTLTSDGQSWVERAGLLRVAEQDNLSYIYNDDD